MSASPPDRGGAGSYAARIDRAQAPGDTLLPRGRWTLQGLGADAAAHEAEIARLNRLRAPAWDLTGIDALDAAGAVVLWRGWGRRLPVTLALTPDQQRFFAQLAQSDARRDTRRVPVSPLEWLMRLGRGVVAIGRHGADMVALAGQLLIDVGHMARHPGQIPLREFSANLYKSGVAALPVSALVGFLVGVVLSYLSALQLRSVGADVFIVNILGIGILRELGPVLVAVLVAGRSGSAMTAQLGVMRVTEEIDALATMGVSRTIRLVWPKILGLAVAMPLLVLWTSAIALVGGMLAAQFQLDIGIGFFIEQLPRTVPIGNFWIGLGKGLVFGIIIAFIACHFGLRVRPNTESLSANTTSSVVAAITAVILVDAVIAILTRRVGVPW